MDELWELYSQAQDIEVFSAEEIHKYDTTPYRMGRLLITAVFLKDVGLIGRNHKVPQHDEEDTYVAVDESEALAAMGLPCSFGSQSKTASRKDRNKKKNTPAAAISGSEVLESEIGLAGYILDELEEENGPQAEPNTTGMTWQQLELLYGPEVAAAVSAAASKAGSHASRREQPGSSSGKEDKQVLERQQPLQQQQQQQRQRQQQRQLRQQKQHEPQQQCACTRGATASSEQDETNQGATPECPGGQQAYSAHTEQAGTRTIPAEGESLSAQRSRLGASGREEGENKGINRIGAPGQRDASTTKTAAKGASEAKVGEGGACLLPGEEGTEELRGDKGLRSAGEGWRNRMDGACQGQPEEVGGTCHIRVQPDELTTAEAAAAAAAATPSSALDSAGQVRSDLLPLGNGSAAARHIILGLQGGTAPLISLGVAGTLAAAADHPCSPDTSLAHLFTKPTSAPVPPPPPPPSAPTPPLPPPPPPPPAFFPPSPPSISFPPPFGISPGLPLPPMLPPHMPPPFPYGPPLQPPTMQDGFPLPPIHPYLLSCSPLAMEWQQVFDSGQGELLFFHLPSGTIQQQPPLEGFVPVQLQQEADMARHAMAMHAHAHAGAAAAQHAQRMAAAAAAAPLAQEPEGPRASVPAAAATAAVSGAVRRWGTAGGDGVGAPDPAPQRRFVRGAIDVSALESSMQQPVQPTQPLPSSHGLRDNRAQIEGGQSLAGSGDSARPLTPMSACPAASPTCSLPPPPPILQPPPFPTALQPPTPVGLLSQTKAYAEVHERSHVLPPPPSLVPPHAAYHSSSGSLGAQASISISSSKAPPPGFAAPPPQPRPETTGMLPSLPIQGGIHTYFESTDSASGCHSGAVAGAPSALQSSGDGSEGVQGSGAAGVSCGLGGEPGEVTSGLQYFAEAEETGLEVDGTIQGLQAGQGGAQVRVEGVVTKGKKQKKKQWPEVQGDEASEAREAALKKAMAATMALLPDGDQEGERVVMDPSLAAYVRSILPRNVAKYWLQRYSLFTKYDEGIQLDTEGWWSVTPEILATHQSSLCKRYSRGHVALDAMAGCAGNAIQLTKDFSVVYAVEISKRRADMARNNAEVYGVGSQVEVLCTDFFRAAPLLFAETIFVSPPWGGPKYKWCDTFEVLETVEGMAFSIKHLILTALDVVRRSTTGPASHARSAAGDQRRQPSFFEASGNKLCAGVRSLLAAAAPSLSIAPMHPPPPPIPRFVSGTFDLASLEAKRSQEAPIMPSTQHMATASCGHAPPAPSTLTKSTTQGVVAVFLPRNTDLKQLESLVPQGKVWHVERNYVNGRLKGISFYCFS